jgi:hypothetical protein
VAYDVTMDKNDIALNETVVFLIRETGWSLEYIRALPLKTLNQMVEELRYQKAVDEYRLLRAVAMGVAVWASAQHKHRRFRPEDFVGNQPTREEIKRR